MARITSPGTFMFCKGAMILDGWTVDCEGGSVLTEPEMLELVLRYITGSSWMHPSWPRRSPRSRKWSA